jgi:hypothetical protein
MGLKELAKAIIRRTKRKVAYKDIHAESSSLKKHRNDRQVIRTVCRSTRPEQYVGEAAKESRGTSTSCDPLELGKLIYTKNLLMARGAGPFTGSNGRVGP